MFETRRDACPGTMDLYNRIETFTSVVWTEPIEIGVRLARNGFRLVNNLLVDPLGALASSPANTKGSPSSSSSLVSSKTSVTRILSVTVSPTAATNVAAPAPIAIVECVYCNCIVVWSREVNREFKDTPYLLHLRLSPLCEYAKSKLPKPVHLRYQLFAARVESFSNTNEWRKHYNFDKYSMADAGFFYTGIEDRVECFFCAGSLDSWEVDDDPWQQHALKFDRCPYVLYKKGSDYICRVFDLFDVRKKESDEERHHDSRVACKTCQENVEADIPKGDSKSVSVIVLDNTTLENCTALTLSSDSSTDSVDSNGSICDSKECFADAAPSTSSTITATAAAPTAATTTTSAADDSSVDFRELGKDCPVVGVLRCVDVRDKEARDDASTQTPAPKRSTTTTSTRIATTQTKTPRTSQASTQTRNVNAPDDDYDEDDNEYETDEVDVDVKRKRINVSEDETDEADEVDLKSNAKTDAAANVDDEDEDSLGSYEDADAFTDYIAETVRDLNRRLFPNNKSVVDPNPHRRQESSMKQNRSTQTASLTVSKNTQTVRS